MSLNTLKIKLQESLNESTDYMQAISDAQYACDLGSEAALSQWIKTWSYEADHLPADLDYQEGVQFVADTWKNIIKFNNWQLIHK